MSLRIFLVDDHEIVRRGVRDMLEAEDDFEVVGEAGTVEEPAQLSWAGHVFHGRILRRLTQSASAQNDRASTPVG